MPPRFHEFGVRCEGPPKTERATRLRAACQNAADFRVVELRTARTREAQAEVIIIECINDQVAQGNEVGIKVRERLALLIPERPDGEILTLALRVDFPLVAHLTQCIQGGPP